MICYVQFVMFNFHIGKFYKIESGKYLRMKLIILKFVKVRLVPLEIF